MGTFAKTVIITGGFVLAAGTVAAPALAYPSGTDLTVTAGNGEVVVANAQPGCTVTVKGEGYTQDATIDSDGMAVIHAGLPDSLDLSVTVAGSGCLTESSQGAVANSDGAEGGGSQSRTGPDTALGLIAGVGALGVGGGLVVAARRKKA